MSEIVDRIAQAIAISGNGGTWDDWFNEDQREFHRKRARAAIEALRDVPDLCWDNYRCDKIWRDLNSKEVWNLWLDAILMEFK